MGRRGPTPLNKCLDAVICVIYPYLPSTGCGCSINIPNVTSYFCLSQIFIGPLIWCFVCGPGYCYTSSQRGRVVRADNASGTAQRDGPDRCYLDGVGPSIDTPRRRSRVATSQRRSTRAHSTLVTSAKWFVGCASGERPIAGVFFRRGSNLVSSKRIFEQCQWNVIYTDVQEVAMRFSANKSLQNIHVHNVINLLYDQLRSCAFLAPIFPAVARDLTLGSAATVCLQVSLLNTCCYALEMKRIFMRIFRWLWM